MRHWTDEMRAEARAEWDRLGSSNKAAATLSERWGSPVSGALLRNMVASPTTRRRGAPVAASGADSLAAVLAERAAPASAPTADQTVCILADLHVPEHDEAAVACALSWIEREQPATVVLAGDVGEWESCSQHGTSPAAPSFRADLEVVEDFLRRLRKAAPNARCLWLEGNHETRLVRMLCSQAPTLHGAISIPLLLGLDSLGIEWVPEDKRPQFSVGTLDVIHGHQMLRGSGPVYVAAKGVNVFGSPGRTVAIAHTHKRQQFRRAMATGFAEAVTLPCLRSIDAGWLHGEVSGWSHGFAVATVRDGRRTTLEVVDIERGECVWGGRVYSGAQQAA